MALISLYDCDCGKEHILYLPYEMLIKELISQRIKDPDELSSLLAIAEEIDESEQVLEELELVKVMARSLNSQFSHAGVNEVVQCSKCGRVRDLVKILSMDL